MAVCRQKSVLSRTVLLLFLLAFPRPDPLCLAQSGRFQNPDPGATLCFSVQFGGWNLPDLGIQTQNVPLNEAVVCVFLMEMFAAFLLLFDVLYHLW